MNALLGAVVTIVLAFTTVSPIIGGAVAGYLQRGNYASGAKAGGLSGLIAGLLGFIVLSFVPLFAGVSLSMFGMREMAVMPHWLFWGFWAGFLFVVGLIVAMGAAGGALGVYLAEYRARGARSS